MLCGYVKVVKHYSRSSGGGGSAVGELISLRRPENTKGCLLLHSWVLNFVFANTHFTAFTRMEIEIEK